MPRSVAKEALRAKRDQGLRIKQPRELKDFGPLVRDLSTAMTRACADAVDVEIETWLGKICNALDLDRAAIYQRLGPDGPVRTTHQWLRANFPPFPPNYDPEKFVKTTTDWVMSGNSFAFSSPSEIPRHLSDTKLFVERYGPKASVILPMWAGSQVIGGASFGKFRSPRLWSVELLEHLGLVVRLFGGAIERKQAEMTLRTIGAGLRIASRRTTMIELVASISHEINQPLSAILSNLGGVTHLLSQKSPDLRTASVAIKNAVADTKRAAEIIRRVRATLKAHPERKTAIGVGVLISGVIKLLRSEAAMRRISLRTEISPSVQRVLGDRTQLQQCLMNLLLNAFDAITETDPDRRVVTIKVVPEEAGWIRVSVCDTGSGIDASVAPRLFEPFVTTKVEGLGLGLLVTRSIVGNHGGKIWSNPNRGGGTTFTFTLPAAQKRIASPLKKRPSK
jgi:signal transduction histidine kinase